VVSNRRAIAASSRLRGRTLRVSPRNVKPKTFKVFLMAGKTSRGTYVYVSNNLPAVGDTIFVRKTAVGQHGDPETSRETAPVPARVTRVRAGVITAAEMPQ
jgi:hypothetical protein